MNIDTTRQLRRPAKLVALLSLAFLAIACNDDLRKELKGNAATSGTILSAVSQVGTGGGTSGSLVDDVQPVGTDTNFALTLTPNAPAVTNGGTATISATAASPFSEIYLSVEGLAGYYRVVLPAPTTSTDLRVTVDQDYRQPSITFAVSAGDGTNTGPIALQGFTVVIVGSGDIQVSITFDRQDDLDLAVVDPMGDRVDFATTTVASGGTLDLDANPACTAPFGNSENVTWPQGRAIMGDYQVRVAFFDSCTGQTVNYTVTVTVVGNPPQIFSGSFAPGAVGTEVLITTFNVALPLMP
jgi:hypothetical protein